MPDTSLSWANMKDHLRRYGVIYIVVIGVMLVGANLLWTSTAPRVPEEQRVLIYLADAQSNAEPLNALATDLLTEAQAYDPTLREIAFESLLFSDPDQDYTGMMVLMARLAAGEGDLFLAGPKAMEALTRSGACETLDDALAGGWMAGRGLEPWYGDYVDPDTGVAETRLSGLKLDTLDALFELRAFYNEGGALAVAVNSTNQETAMKVAELLVDRLIEEGKDHA